MRRIIKYLMLSVSILSVFSCQREENPAEPVTTKHVSAVHCKSATLNGSVNITKAESATKISAFLLYSDSESTVEGLEANGTKVDISSLSGDDFSSIVNYLKPGTTYYYVAGVKFIGKTYYGEVKNFSTLVVPDGAVDLGLSVLWHQCNIEASKPEEYGRYFAGGDPVGQTWNGSSWSRGGFSSLPYEVDENKTLKPEYDAAQVILGGGWRMPTKAEMQELIDNCNCTWTDNYNKTGVAGRIFTSKKEGYRIMSIFLPATGSGFDRGLYDTGIWAGYWSSTFTNGNEGYSLAIDSEKITLYGDCSYRGFPVRPVLD